MEAVLWGGKAISKPGLYRGVPLAAYHSANICDGPSVSSSGLRRIDPDNGGSPAHFYSEWPGNPKREEEKEKRHFILGRAVHHLMLGERWFSRLFVVRPKQLKYNNKGLPEAVDFGGHEWPRRGTSNIAQEWLAIQRRLNKSVLTEDEIEDIKGMAVGLGRLPLVRAGILNGQIERSVFWKDKATGVWLKSRPDAIPTGSGDFADLKTTISVQWHDLMYAITEFRYHQQGALTRTAAAEVLGIPKDRFTFTLAFIEKKNPWCARTVQLKPQDLDMGEAQNRKAIDIFAACLKSGEWPGPGENDDAPFIDLQDYYRNRISEGLNR